MARGAQRGPGKRVRINREAVDAIRLGWADGTQEVGERIIATARPNVPDAPPLGKGLLGGGMVVTLVDRRKIAGAGPTAKIPRSGRAPAQGIVTYVGYGYPGRFAELGTSHSAPEPFLTPAMGEELGGAGAVVAHKIEQHLKRVRDLPRG